MSDDKKKKEIDSWFLSMEEKYEVDYFVKDIMSEVIGVTREQVMEVLHSCVQQIKPSEGREKIKACVLSKLTPRLDRDDRPKQPNRTHA